MNKEELYSTLKPIADCMVNNLASKQHVLTQHIDIIKNCKKSGINNVMILEAINHNIPEKDKIKLTYFKNILYRAGCKRGEKKEATKTTTTAAPTNNEKNGNIKQTIASSDIEQTQLDEYLSVCFHNERLAKRAIEGGVSISTIESWNSPNAQRMSTILTNFLLEK